MKTKLPHQLTSGLYRFPPNRDTLGGTAYLLTLKQGDSVLIDCPPWNDSIQEWLTTQGTIRWLCLTHRGGHSPGLKAIQAQLGCQIIVQEQEAYLLPHLSVCRFREALNITADLTAIWTPGHSPGSCCYYWKEQGGILFTGRHLVPTPQQPLALQQAPKTFHWPRQQNSVQKLQKAMADKSLAAICPGANLGYLRGKEWLVDSPHDLLNNLGYGKSVSPIK